MNSRILCGAVLLAIPAIPLFGQSGQIAGPAIGFVFDGSVHALRPILGIPGAATLGDPLDAGFALSSATVAPRQDSAIVTAADGSLHLLRLASGAAEVLCGACPSTAEDAVFSPSGTAVALYSAGRVQIVTGLPDAPAAGAAFEVGSMPRLGHRAPMAPPMALSDDGAWLLASSSVAVNLFGSNGGPRQLLAAGPDAPVAFAPGSHDAAVAAAGGTAVTLFHDVAGASTEQPLTAPDGVRHINALAFSADGSRLYVSSGAEQSVTAIDIASGTSTAAVCDCALSVLVPMGNVLRLNGLGNGPLWLLDSAAARVVFVPPAQ
jgi:hypothetical protein